MNTEENFEASGLEYSNEVRVHISSANIRTQTAPSDVELSTADILDKFMRTQMLCQLKWEKEVEQREKDAMLCQLKWEREAEQREKGAMLCQLKWEREAEQREKDAAEQAKLLTELSAITRICSSGSRRERRSMNKKRKRDK